MQIPLNFSSWLKSRISLSFHAIGFGLVLLVSGCGATGPQYTALQPSRPTAGILYVYRPASFVNGAISPGISVDGKEYAALPSGGYMAFELEKGYHTVDLVLSGRYSGDSSMSVEVLPQVATYLRLDTSIGEKKRLFSLNNTFSPTADAEIRACMYQDPNGPRFSKSYFWSHN